MRRFFCDNISGTTATITGDDAHHICRVLRMNIMTFRLKPGEPLSEIEIAKLFQMSRTPVHEAITTLHNDWLIEIFPQRGTQVSRIDPALVKEGYSTRLRLESA